MHTGVRVANSILQLLKQALVWDDWLAVRRTAKAADMKVMPSVLFTRDGSKELNAIIKFAFCLLHKVRIKVLLKSHNKPYANITKERCQISSSTREEAAAVNEAAGCLDVL